MKKQYAIIDVTTGDYVYYDASQDMIPILAENILEAHLRLTHNNLWSVIDYDETEARVWRNAIGDEIPDPVAVKTALAAEILALIESSTESTSTSSVTVVS